MAEAESQALAASGGILACSPHMWRLMMEAEEAEKLKVKVPADVIEQVKADERN